jgi:hypothetical protein
MAHYNFRKDITVGEKGEQIVRTQLEAEGAIYNGDNKNNEYDISMTMPNGKELKFEIKTDVWCMPGRELQMPFGTIQVPPKDSGNMFIEFECRGKSSGIVVTKADYFITYYPYYNEIWYITTKKLIELIKNEKFPTTKQSGDEDSNTRGYLIPREKYKNNFKVVKTDYEWEN